MIGCKKSKETLKNWARVSLGIWWVCGWISLGALQAAPSPRQLFLDPSFLTEVSGSALRVNPVQSSQAVIHPDKPWEQLMISFYTSVIEEDGKLRLWYICRDADNKPNVAYAESRDGVTWTKPDLGIVDYHGSKQNNLVGLNSLDGAVFKDPHGQPGEAYVYVAHVANEGVFRFVSADGLHWKRDAKPLMPFRADTQNIVLWEETKQRYAVYLRAWDVGKEWTERMRKVVRYEATSLATPSGVMPLGKGSNPGNAKDLPRLADELPTVLSTDAKDPAKADVYTLPAQLYPLDPRWYVGFPSFFLRDKNISDGRLEVQFVGSRDGVHWSRYDRASYVPPGLDHSASASMTFIGPGMVVRGDEIWQFGTGFRNRHGAVEKRKENPEGTIFRHVQRVDGFVSLDFDSSGGRATTRPVKVTGSKLLLNLDTGALGELRVALHDAGGQPLAGFEVERCVPLSINSTGVVVGWEGKADLAALQGRDVTLEFRASRTKLYSFRFEQ